MPEENGKCFLYEANSTHGTIFLTIDDNSPLFINFCHRIKIDIQLGKGKQSLLSQFHKLRKRECLVADSQEHGNYNFAAQHKDGSDDHCLLNQISETKHDEVASFSPELRPSETWGEKCEIKAELHETVIHAKRENVSHGRASSNYIVGTCSKEPLEIQTVRNKSGRKKNKHKVPSMSVSGKVFRMKKSCKLTLDKNPSYSKDHPEIEMDVAVGDTSCQTDLKLPAGVKASEGNVNITCEFCFKTFYSRKDFFNHRRSKNEHHKCNKCKKTFSFQAYLLIHMKEHRALNKNSRIINEKLVVCDICGNDSKNLTSLKKHMLSHTGECYYKCCVCDKNMSGFGAMNNHMVSHRSAGWIKCNCCEQHFSSRAELSKHQLALLQIKCHLCGEVFPNRTSRTVHYKLAHSDSILRCQICSFMFSSEEELASHMIYHSKYKKKQCTICGKFVSRLEKHVLTHQSLKDMDESQLFMCDKCPMKFMLKSSLQRHQRTHSQERPFECYQCPKTFACRSVLLKHIKSHSSVMPYECEVCGKRCKEKSNLKVHMRTHSDTKAFPCTVCTQAFGYKNSLEAHMRSKHAPKHDTMIVKRKSFPDISSLEPNNANGRVEPAPTPQDGDVRAQVSGINVNHAAQMILSQQLECTGIQSATNLSSLPLVDKHLSTYFA